MCSSDLRKHPPSPPMDEGNTQDFADDKLCFYDSDDEEEYELMPNENIILKMMKNMVWTCYMIML